MISISMSEKFCCQKFEFGLQNGFRETRSCETQLNELVKDLRKQLTEYHQLDLVFLDFSKAIDKVNH